MHASRQISRGLLLRAKAAPLQTWLPSILPPGQTSRHLTGFSTVFQAKLFHRFAPPISLSEVNAPSPLMQEV